MTTLDTTHPFRRGTAIEHGIGTKRLRGPGFQRVLPGILLRADVPVTPLIRAEAALTTVKGPAHVSHASAARILGVPVPTIPDEFVTVPEPSARSATGGVRYVVRHRTDSVTVAGIPVSSPVQLFEELATILPLVDLVVAGDHLVRRHGVSCRQLGDQAAALRG